MSSLAEIVLSDRVVPTPQAMRMVQAMLTRHTDRRPVSLAYWTSGSAPDGTGLPQDVLLAGSTQTTVPARDFGTPGNRTRPAGAIRAALR